MEEFVRYPYNELISAGGFFFKYHPEIINTNPVNKNPKKRGLTINSGKVDMSFYFKKTGFKYK